MPHSYTVYSILYTILLYKVLFLQMQLQNLPQVKVSTQLLFHFDFGKNISRGVNVCDPILHTATR